MISKLTLPINVLYFCSKYPGAFLNYQKRTNSFGYIQKERIVCQRPDGNEQLTIVRIRVNTIFFQCPATDDPVSYQILEREKHTVLDSALNEALTRFYPTTFLVELLLIPDKFISRKNN